MHSIKTLKYCNLIFLFIFMLFLYCAYCVLMLSTSLLSVMKTPVYPSKKILSFLCIKNANTY